MVVVKKYGFESDKQKVVKFLNKRKVEQKFD